MSDNDNFFGLFKESSETERPFDPKPASWDKLSNRLNNNRKAKWKKGLVLLPWITLPFLVVWVAALYQQQQFTEERLIQMNQQLKSQAALPPDTVIQLKETRVYFYDTVYIHHQPKHLYLTESNAFTKRISATSLSGSVRNQHPETRLSASSNEADAPLATATPEKGQVSASTEMAKAADENEVSKPHQVTPILPVKPALSTTEVEQEQLRNKTTTTKQEPDTHTLSKEKQSAENKIDTLVLVAENKNEITTEHTAQQKGVPFKERFKDWQVEYGLDACAQFPISSPEVKQFGMGIGAGLNVSFSTNFQLWMNGGYNYVRIRSTSLGQVPWMPNLLPEDSTYQLEKARATIPVIDYTIGLRYLPPSTSRLRALIDVGYGLHYYLPYRLLYEFENGNPNQDLLLEKKRQKAGLVMNDVEVGVGLQYRLDEKRNMYFLAHYRFNKEGIVYKQPDYIGLSIGLFW
jgi:hypothetical protein